MPDETKNALPLRDDPLNSMDPASASEGTVLSSQDTSFNPDVEPPTAASPSDVAPSTDSANNVGQQGSPVPPPTSANPAQSLVPSDTSPQPIPLTPSPVQTMVAPPKKSKKKFVIGGVIVCLLALFGGGSAFAYTMYQQPDKVIADGFMNLAKKNVTGGDGTITITSDQADVSVAISSKSSQNASAGTAKVVVKLKEGELSGKQLDVTADSVFIKDGTVYVRINNLDKVFDTALDTYFGTATFNDDATSGVSNLMYRTLIEQMYKPVIDKLNNQWIKITADDLKDANEEASDSLKCITDVYAKLRDDKNMSQEVADAYRQHVFIIVKEQLGTKDGSMGYVLDIDKDKAEAFSKAAENTGFAKSLTACDDSESDSSSFSASTDDSIKNGRFELCLKLVRLGLS